MTDADGLNVVVAVANGEYATLRRLARAVPDTAGLVALLGDRHGFTGTLLADLRRGPLRDELDAALAPDGLRGAALIVLWTGHAVVGPNRHLSLLVRTTDTADDEALTAEKLGELASRTGASQVLVVLDTCYSGQGVPEAADAAHAVFGGRADPGAAWFGVVAASRSDEEARSGAMARELARLFTDGPTDLVLRARWDPNNPWIRGDDLMDALVKEWSEERHRPDKMDMGNALYMLVNPLHRPKGGQAVVEHLLQAARGTSGDEVFFTGREAILTRIVAWMRRRRRGLFVVTGPPGSGKSAIVGRIVSLSVPEERRRLSGIEADQDPGESSVDVHLHARGLRQKAAREMIVAQLGLDDGARVHDVLALASRRRREGRSLVVVVDGLDEAGQVESREIAAELLEPISREALVLVATREVPGTADEPSLLATLGTASETVDLGTDTEATLRDVHGYVMGRLRDVSPNMGASLVADEIVSMARAARPGLEGPFLFARLVTSQLRSTPADTREPEWRDRLASSVEAALETDLERAVLTVDGRPHPTAARELLHALTFAYGAGMPADDVWPAIATALSPTGTRYTRDDAYALLAALGRHVVSSAERGQVVYRVAHQRLVDHLRPTHGVGTAPGLPPAVGRPVADAVAGLYERLLDEGQGPTQHGYLWWHAWRHLADAGTHGIERLRLLVARDRSAFLPDLAEAIGLVITATIISGSAPDAVALALAEELVTMRRELDDRLALVSALFEQAFARTFAGDFEGADAAATEAVEVARAVARQAEDDPNARMALAGGLMTQALTQLNRGNADAAWALAVESVRLIEAEADVGGDPEIADALAAPASVAARAAFLRGDVQQADDYSRRALDAVDRRAGDGQPEIFLLEVLQVRALVELVLVHGAAASGRLRELPRPSAAARMVAHYRETGPTGTISDVLLANGLRLFAATSWALMKVGSAGDDVADPASLLDEAVALVSEVADRSVDATLVLALALFTRASLAASRAEALTYFAEAERRLRPVAASSPLISAQLGEIIGAAVATAAGDPAADVGALIERQYEAGDLLGASHNRRSRELLVAALFSLAQLLQRAGRTDELAGVLEAVVGECRGLLDGSEARSLALAAALADLSGAICLNRPVEAIQFATEALEILQAADAANPTVLYLLGICETNICGASILLNRPADARRSAERAVELLGGRADAPAPSWVLATALSNLVALQLAEGENEAALERALQATDLLQQPGSLAPAWLLPCVRINLGRAQRALGREAEAAEAIGGGLADLRRQLSEGLDVLAPLANALNVAGPAAWDTVLSDLAESPEIAIRLALHRWRPADEFDQAIATTVEGLRVSGGSGDLARAVHEAARADRAVDPERFDALWVQTVGEVPDWLSIDPSLSYLFVAWWNADSLHRSRSHLLANPALLDPATDILVEEVRAAGGDGDKADWHLKIRATAAAAGVEAAYAPVLAEALVAEWYDAADQEAFLAERVDELLAPEVSEVLRQHQGDEEADAYLAVLVLARRGEPAAAFRVIRDADFGIALLRPAWRSADAERLAALATLCLRSETLGEPQRRLATVALAIGRAIAGAPDDAIGLVRSVAPEVTAEDERSQLLGAVSDALAYQSGQQDELLGLLRELRSEAP